MSALHGGPRVFVMADGIPVRSDQPVIEAERELRKRAWQDAIDEKRREWDADVERMCLEFGFDEQGELL